MTAVTKEEGQISLDRLLEWARNDKHPAGAALGQWIFNRYQLRQQFLEPVAGVSDVIASKTTNAVQRNLTTVSEFPCCPKDYEKNPLTAYVENLEPGLVFCQNNIFTSVVFKSTLSADGTSIFVIADNQFGLKHWALSEISFEDNLFVHTSLGTFFTQKGIEKEYCCVQGLTWEGGDTFDDNC